jgi:uncharacterized membrane protein
MRRRVGLIPVIVALLIVEGVSASIGRALHVDSLGSRLEPVRSAVIHAAGIADPFASERDEMVARLDTRYGEHRFVTYVHVVLGGLFLLVAPLQFSGRLRRRSPSVHRWNGRVLVGVAVTLAVSGLFFGAFVPLAGAAERVVVLVFTTVLIVALVAAVVSIRRGAVRSHRAWMIRAFAVMIGIATIRVVAPGLDIVMTPLGFAPETVFVTALWTGWGGTLGAAEYWLRSSPSGVQHVRQPSAV